MLGTTVPIGRSTAFNENNHEVVVGVAGIPMLDESRVEHFQALDSWMVVIARPLFASDLHADPLPSERSWGVHTPALLITFCVPPHLKIANATVKAALNVSKETMVIRPNEAMNSSWSHLLDTRDHWFIDDINPRVDAGRE